jgi:hypothetical protein
MDLFIYCDPAQRPRFFSLIEEMSSVFAPTDFEIMGKAVPEFKEKVIAVLDRHYKDSRVRERVVVALNAA